MFFFQDTIIATLKVQKILSPGRLVIITHKYHRNKLAMILSLVKGKQLSFKVLVLSSLLIQNETDEKEDFWHYMLALAMRTLYFSEDQHCHEILKISANEIFEITSKTLHFNSDVIIKDVEKRQMERFKDAPPGQTCVEAVSELHKLTISANSGDPQKVLKYLHYVADIKVNEHELYYKLKEMYDFKEKLLKHLPDMKDLAFEQLFGKIFKKKHLEDKRRNLQFLLSHESLSLYPEYQSRIELLKRMEYVDSQNRRKYTNLHFLFKNRDRGRLYLF